MPHNKQLIFVLGMHRSGTSAVTRLLNLLGVTLGNDLLSAKPDINENGFWEHNALLKINENALETLQSAWFDFTSYPANWQQQEQFKNLQKQIKQFIEHTFSSAEQAALKDPRLCRLLPLWLEALKSTDNQLKAVLVLRHPQEVIQSLCKRDLFTPETALLLWACHTRDAELASRNMPRSIIQYQSVLENWQHCAEQMANDLNLQWQELSTVITEQINNEISPSLKHHHAETAKPETGLETICTEIWQLMTSTPLDLPKLDEVWQRLDQIINRCNAVSQAAFAANKKIFFINSELSAKVEYRDNALQEKLQQLEKIGLSHQESLNIISERDTQLSHLNKQLEELGRTHQQTLDIIISKDEQLISKNEQLEKIGQTHNNALGIISERDTQLSDLNKQIDALGIQHQHALSIIQERDLQLQITSKQLSDLLSNRVVRGLNKLLKLTVQT